MESNLLKTASDFINNQTAASGGDPSSQQGGNSKLLDFLKHRFAGDTRYKEVANFLSSAKEIVVKLEHIHNREALTEEQLTGERVKLLDKQFLR